MLLVIDITVVFPRGSSQFPFAPLACAGVQSPPSFGLHRSSLDPNPRDACETIP